MDKFYLVEKCDRCNRPFVSGNRRIQSWFTSEVICSDSCSVKERDILKTLGDKKNEFEGCGFIPQLNSRSGCLRLEG